ncbi:protein of unknown function [Ruminococcaceae bacterium BL-6]|nr:protein of unknown function [Ruminococcaceae bacterium BL-6]
MIGRFQEYMGGPTHPRLSRIGGRYRNQDSNGKSSPGGRAVCSPIPESMV